MNTSSFPTSSSPTSSPPAPARPRLAFWLRLLRRTALVLAAFLVLLALAYGFENLRGWQTLKAERDRLLAAGRKVDFEDFIPPAVPDDRNFAMIPLLRPMLDLVPDRNATNRWRDPAGSKRAQELLAFWKINGRPRWPAVADSAHGEPINLAEWQAFFRSPPEPAAADQELRKRYGLPPVSNVRAPDTNAPPAFPLPSALGTPAEDILRALGLFEADFAGLHEGLQRPEGRYPLAYEDGYETLLPHLALLKRLASAFSLRASARLATGDGPGAFADLEDALKVGESLRTESILISQLVRQACITIALGAFWEGQLRHAWTEPQLAALQARLEAVDLAEGFRRGIGAERAQALRAVERMAGSLSERQRFADLASGIQDDTGRLYSDPILAPYLLLAPRGWLFASAAATSQALEQLERLNTRELPGFRNAWIQTNDAPSLRLRLHHHYVHSSFITGFANSTVRSYQNDFRVHLAIIACALERHRLARGSYPEQLAALVPAFLPAAPVDPLAGTPLAYRREDNDRFRVWSVGEDGQDDGGAWPQRGARDSGPETGDWVWGWPPPRSP